MQYDVRVRRAYLQTTIRFSFHDASLSSLGFRKLITFVNDSCLSAGDLVRRKLAARLVPFARSQVTVRFD